MVVAAANVTAARGATSALVAIVAAIARLVVTAAVVRARTAAVVSIIGSAARVARAAVVSVARPVVVVARAAVAIARAAVVRRAHARTVGGAIVAIGTVAVMAATPVASVVTMVYAGTAEVVVAVAIAVEDGVVPAVYLPAQGAEEVIDGGVEVILPVEQDVADVLVAIAPTYAIEVGGRTHAKEVVEVDLINLVILVLRKVQFVGHLVREEVGVVASYIVGKGFERSEAAKHSSEGK